MRSAPAAAFAACSHRNADLRWQRAAARSPPTSSSTCFTAICAIAIATAAWSAWIVTPTREMVEVAPASTRVVEFRDADGGLVGVSLTDCVRSGLSGVYKFFAPRRRPARSAPSSSSGTSSARVRSACPTSIWATGSPRAARWPTRRASRRSSSWTAPLPVAASRAPGLDGTSVGPPAAPLNRRRRAMSGTFRAVRLEQVDGRTRADVADVPSRRSAAGRGAGRRRLLDAELQGRAGDHRRRQDRAPVPVRARHRSRRHGAAVRPTPRFKPGDEVLLTGWGVGERHWGGLAEQARVKADWLLPLPAGLSLEQAMAIGTAGFTAMLAVLALEEQGVTPERGESRGHRRRRRRGQHRHPAAAPGRLPGRGIERPRRSSPATSRSWVPRRSSTANSFSEGSKAPLDSARWAGAVDTVGGATLVNLLKAHAVPWRRSPPAGSPAARRCNGTVFPFILRGVRLDRHQFGPLSSGERPAVWERLAARPRSGACWRG